MDRAGRDGFEYYGESVGHGLDIVSLLFKLRTLLPVRKIPETESNRWGMRGRRLVSHKSCSPH